MSQISAEDENETGETAPSAAASFVEEKSNFVDFFLRVLSLSRFSEDSSDINDGETIQSDIRGGVRKKERRRLLMVAAAAGAAECDGMGWGSPSPKKVRWSE